MSEKKATRNAYGDALVALADRYPQLVVLEADLAGATMTKGFKAAYPQRFFDMGIAESNMQGVAAGLSTCGFKPFTNTFAMFAAGRSWEQVRNSIAYPGMNVKVVGSHGGLSVGEDGSTISIDADNYTYEAQCEETGSTGDITEDEDGRGIYLYLNGHGFLIPDAERSTFTIQFVAADFQMPDGNYETTYSRA